jgi:hypothetical protein
MKRIFCISVLSVICGQANVCAQSQYDVTVNSAFSPSIGDAQRKINAKAHIMDTASIERIIGHHVTPLVYQSVFKPEPIKAPKVGKDKVVRLYRNFIKAGFGNYWTPYLDLEINSLRSTRYAYGVRAFHHSSWGKIKHYATPASLSDTKGEIFGEKFFNHYTLNGNLGYNHRMTHNYGLPADSQAIMLPMDVVPAKTRQQFHMLDMHLDFAGNRQPQVTKLNQYYGLDYNYVNADLVQTWSENGIHHEHQLKFLARLHHDIHFKRAGFLSVGGETGIRYFKHNHPLLQDRITFHNVIFNLKPQVSYTYEEYYIKAGLDIVMHRQSASLQWHVYPDIEAKMTVVPEILTVFAGLNGGLKDNSYRRQAQENPHLSAYNPALFTNERARLYLGLQAGVARGLTMGAKASFAWVDDMSFFFPDTLTFHARWYHFANTFTNIPASVKHLNLRFNLCYTYKQELMINFYADYNYYKTSGLERPWYKPVFTAQFNGQYLLLKKFLFSLDFYINAGVPYPKWVPGNGVEAKILKAVLDFDFGFEYLWSQRFSIFAHIHNFAFQRNFYYYDYPSQRLNALIGVKYCFGGEKTGKK